MTAPRNPKTTENIDFVEAAWAAGAQSGSLDMVKSKEIYDHFVKGGLVNINGPVPQVG